MELRRVFITANNGLLTTVYHSLTQFFLDFVYRLNFMKPSE